MMRTLLICLVIPLLSCSALRSGQNKITAIHYGSSFGHCRGYCYQEFRYTEDGYTHFQKGWDTVAYPPKLEVFKMEAAYWQQLTASVDADSVFALPERIGCPDCADQGAEWIEIFTEGKSHRVTFEYQQNPPGLEALLRQLRI